MKRVVLSAVSAAAFVAALSAQGVSTQELYTEAQRAMMRGDNEMARLRFSQLLELDPKDLRARNSLRMLDQQERAAGGGPVVQKRLEQLRVPKVEFKDATLDAALDYVRQQAEKLSGGDLKLNFVMKLTPQQQLAKVSLSLTDIPLLEVLKYTAELAGAKLTFQTHAIVVSPLRGGNTSGSVSDAGSTGTAP